MSHISDRHMSKPYTSNISRLYYAYVWKKVSRVGVIQDDQCHRQRSISFCVSSCGAFSFFSVRFYMGFSFVPFVTHPCQCHRRNVRLSYLFSPYNSRSYRNRATIFIHEKPFQIPMAKLHARCSYRRQAFRFLTLSLSIFLPLFLFLSVSSRLSTSNKANRTPHSLSVQDWMEITVSANGRMYEYIGSNENKFSILMQRSGSTYRRAAVCDLPETSSSTFFFLLKATCECRTETNEKPIASYT